MATWKTCSISDILDEITEEKYVLPVIQRPLVWTEEKMEKLFDTLLKGDSFGGVIVIEEAEGKEPLFNYRPFTKEGGIIASRKVDKLTKVQNFVIDGQQRLQSFYIGLKGSINDKILYFDLYSDFNSEFQFKFENDQNQLPKKSKENADRDIKVHLWFSAQRLYEKLRDTGKCKQVVQEIITSCNIDNDIEKQHIEENILAFNESIFCTKSLGVSKVLINKDFPDLERQRIVELFRRLNDGGTKLSSFDLVASTLKGFAWEMEGFLREALENYEEIGLSQENLIKLIFILQDNYNKEMTAIEAADADFAIKNRNRIKATLKALKDFLIHSKVYDYYKSGNRSFIPLFFIAYHIYHKAIDNEGVATYFDNYEAGNVDFPIIKKWLFNSLVNGVFRSRGAGWIPYKTGIKEIHKVIKKYKNLRFPIDEIFVVYKDNLNCFITAYETNSLEKMDSSFVYYLMYDCAKTIRANDIDHIMPKSLLESKKYDWAKINSIKNYQLIDYGTNRGEKNGKAFSKWINNSAYVTDKKAFVKLHLIPTDETLWTEDKFEEFAEQRAQLIIANINKYTT